MAVYIAVCPQCKGTFDWADGYHDLYEVRLCSLLCRDEWHLRYQYQGVPDAPAVQFAESDPVRHMGDGLRRSPQVSEVAPRKRGEAQME